MKAAQTKVYVMTKARPLKEEQYVDVKGTLKEAEKAFKEMYPYMRKSGSEYLSNGHLDENTYLLFIHEKEIDVDI